MVLQATPSMIPEHRSESKPLNTTGPGPIISPNKIIKIKTKKNYFVDKTLVITM